MTQRLVEAMTEAPAIVRNRRLDIVCANALGYALYAPLYPDPRRPDPSRPANLARFCFFDPRAAELYPNWDDAADTSVALLRTEAGRDPFDRDLSDLVGELSTRSDPFRTRWAAHDVRLHQTGVKRFHHPVVGDLELAFEAMGLSADGIASLASWVATADDTGDTSGTGTISDARSLTGRTRAVLQHCGAERSRRHQVSTQTCSTRTCL